MRSYFARNWLPFVSLVFIGFPVLGQAAEETPAGKAPFVQHCASCHGADGKADFPMAKRLGVRDLTTLTHTNEQLEKAIRDGVKNAKGVLVMPGFKTQLSPEQSAAVIEYVKSLQKKS